MTPSELHALADGLIPVVRDQVRRGFEQERKGLEKTIAALELRILELETRPAVIGPPGPPGPQGEKGADGQAGLRGEAGLSGKDGRDGVDGKDGMPGLNGKDGRDGIDGKDGAPGIDGKNGLNGADGKDGLPGEKGEPADPPMLEPFHVELETQRKRLEGLETRTLLAHRVESDLQLALARIETCEKSLTADTDLSPDEFADVFVSALNEAMTACAPGS